MRLSFRHKLALLALLLICVHLGWRAHQHGWLPRSTSAAATQRTQEAATRLAQRSPLASFTSPAAPATAPATARWVPMVSASSVGGVTHRDTEMTNRLRNTAAPLAQLLRNDRAILLRNALIDTASGEPLVIPDALRSTRPAEAFVVQSTGPVTGEFRDALVRAGATIVSYVPNNALLVQAPSARAEELASAPGAAAILPLEPYFKLTPSLLASALSGSPLPEGLRLVLTIPDAPAELPELAALGAREVFRERGPFGTLVTVEPAPHSLTALAALPSVHRLEPKRQVKLANDLVAFSLGSTTSRENTNSFEDLTGEGVLINVNDSGVDASAPDLEGRVFTLPTEPQVLLDPNGHGTHVAGIIAGNGSQSGLVNNPPPQGSVSNANFQGKAPKASIYALPVDLLFGPASGDAWLQETAAQAPQRFNSQDEVLISNNSWGYIGLDAFEYTTHSASYDAAVRDALPRVSGDQPILYVFSAGNEGAGGNNGIGGSPDSISSPANAKNVITVGALESFRSFTNAVVTDTNGQPVQIGAVVIVPGWETNGGPYFTNEVLLPFTDTDWQVASYSSRGNVGIGIEGPTGRFKPDLVAEGSFVASVRSTQWEPAPLPPEDDPFFPIASLFAEVDAEILPPYRFESGTSMAAPAIAGLLAQLQQNFEYKVNQFPSAAAYKALLINSAQATSPGYVPRPETTINYAGWGKPNLQRALGRGFRARIGGDEVDVIGLDSSTGLATGESVDVVLTVALTNALDRPFRLALVWTDPPGDPLVGPKLVNDLDLIVSNTITGEIYWGNDFDGETSYSRPHGTNEVATNGLPTLDRINNVERIVLPPPVGSNLVITVVAHRVNVNSVRSNPDAIAQDYALAFAADVDPGETNTVGILTFPTSVNPIALAFTRPPLRTVTNGFPLLNQRVGANSPLLGNTNGQFQQWQFYTFTNTPFDTVVEGITNPAGTNVYLITFLSQPGGNLSRARTNGPDVDLYVSRDPALTNLAPDVIANARKSTSRGTFELIDFIGEEKSDNNIFYVGVKSEDHQAGQYAFLGLSTDQLLTDPNGNPTPIVVRLTPGIPDGTPANPGVGSWLALSISPLPLVAVTADVTTTHESFPDLVTELSFNRQTVVLQNHTPLFGLTSGTNIQVNYNDFGLARSNSLPADGPGSLLDFLGTLGSGVWYLDQVDNALGYSGINAGFNLNIIPDQFGEAFSRICIPPNSAMFPPDIVTVLPSASELIVTVTNIVPALPLQVFIRREQYPDLQNPANNDKYAEIPGTGGVVRLGIRDTPPLVSGDYFIVVFNPNSVEVCADYRAVTENNLDASFTRTFVSEELGAISDAARRFSSITVDDMRRVTAIDVGVRMDHARLSDVGLRLSNPNGFSSVLFENRGGQLATALGNTVVTTNNEYQHVALTYDPSSRRAVVYFNGQVAAQSVMPVGFTPATSNQFYFALDPSYQFRNRAVQLDDFGMWRRALRPEEVRDIYLRGIAGEPKQRADRNNGLLSLWPMDPVDRLTGTTPDLVGTNGLTLTFPYRPVSGRFPGSDAILFPELAYGRPTNGLSGVNIRPGSGFTMEGWVYVPPPATNAVIAGWWGESSDFAFGPALVSDGSRGPGSVTAIMTDTNGNQITFTTPPNQFLTGRRVTNILYATFSENTNRANELIKFVPPPFSGQVDEDQVLSFDDFEAAEVRAYAPGFAFRGWEVLSNQVAVLDFPLLALDPPGKFVALSNGVIRRRFDVAVGEKYKVAFAGRLASEETNAINPTLLVDGVAVTPPPLVLRTNEWNTNIVYEIRATKPTMVVEFNGVGTPAGSPGLLFDNVTLLQSSGIISYLPEEPLRPLLGAGVGTWVLELDDTRSPFQGNLLSWQLTMTFAPTSAPAIRLTNGVPFTTNVAGSGVQYFFIDIPLEASTTTNLLQSVTGGPLGLWYNPLGIPLQGGLAEDFPLVYPTVGNAVFARTLDTNVPPVLVPGQRYYLSVENLDPTTSNQFVIQVDLGVKITPLTNAVPLVATNSNQGLFDYYSFNVSSNALGVVFMVTNMSDNLHLVARRAPQLPTRTQFDYASTNVDTLPEVIEITQTSTPVPLSPGPWYLGVYPASTNIGVPITYTIVGIEVQGSVTALTNNVPFDGSITNGSGVAYFSFDIDEDPITATFTLTNLTGNANLYLRRGLPLPSTNSFDYASTNAGLIPEVITLVPGSQPVGLTQGRWFLTVVAVDPLPLNFTVLASYVPNPFTIIPLEDGIPFSYFDAPATNRLYFSFDVPEGINAVLFELYQLTGPANLRVSQGVLPPFARVPNLYVSSNPGTNSQRVAIHSTFDNVPDMSGPWFLEVQVLSTNVIDFTVRAATAQDGVLVSAEPLVLTYSPGPPATITFPAIPGELYSVQSAPDLTGPWTEVSVEFSLSDTITAVIPPPPATETKTFYRVMQIPQ